MSRLILFLAACLAAFAARAIDVPYLSGRVVDNAEILGAETKQKLAAQLNLLLPLQGRRQELASLGDEAMRIARAYAPVASGGH